MLTILGGLSLWGVGAAALGAWRASYDREMVEVGLGALMMKRAGDSRLYSFPWDAPIRRSAGLRWQQHRAVVWNRAICAICPPSCTRITRLFGTVES